MSAMFSWEKGRGLQFLVRSVASSRLDANLLRQSLSRSGNVQSEEVTVDGLLFTLLGRERWADHCAIQWLTETRQRVSELCPAGMNQPPTEECPHEPVEVVLVVPDVYGCQVTVAEGHVEVQVGRDVIDRILHDDEWRNSFLQDSNISAGDAMCVRYLNAGYIAVTHMTSDIDWQWQFSIISMLIELLSPFQAAFPRAPLCVRDRLVDRCSSRSVQDLSSEDCQTDAIICFEETHFALVNSDTFVTRMRSMYPGLQFTCDWETFTLTFSGAGDDVERAKTHILSYTRSLSTEFIPVSDSLALMMEKTEAQTWFQQILDRNDVVCVWGVQKAENNDRWLRAFTSLSEPKPRLSVLATASDAHKFTHIFQLCFQTAVLVLTDLEVRLLQSDAWKQFREDLQKSRGGRISPVLKIQYDRISFSDVASNIGSTRRTLHNFFLEEMGLRPLQPEPQERQREDQELQTEDIRTRTADSQPQTDDQHDQNTEQQTEVTHTQDKHVQPEVLTDAKEVQTEKNPAETEEKQTQTCLGQQHHKGRQTTEEKQTQTCLGQQHHKGQQTTETPVQTGETQTQTEVQSVEHQEQQTGSCGGRGSDNTAGMNRRSSRPSAQRGLDPRSHPQNQNPDPRSYPQNQNPDPRSYPQNQNPDPRSYPQNQSPDPRSYPQNQNPDPRSYPQNQDPDPRSYPQNQRPRYERGRAPQQSTHVADTPHDHLASFTSQEERQLQRRHHHSSRPTNTAPTAASIATNRNTNHGCYSDANNVFHLCLDSASLARLSHFEIGYTSPTSRGRVQQPSVSLESRLIHMERQLDRMIQMQDYSLRPRNNDSGQMVIDNPSATDSAPSS